MIENGYNGTNFKIRSISKRGLPHDSNEDAFFYHVNGTIIYTFVFDGCSSGHNSQFASQLFSKITSKIVKSLLYQQDLNILLNTIIQQFLFDVVSFKNLYQVNTIELLSTIIISITDIERGDSIICHIGDGCHIVNGEHVVIDQNNYPKYLAENLTLDIQEFIRENCLIFEYGNVNDISIFTDGLESFKNVQIDEIFKIFTIDKNLENSLSMLPRLYNILTKNPDIINLDDFTGIRLIL